jgi:hypothetical protein
MKRWSAVINHSRASGKPPRTAEFNWYGALRGYLALDSEVVAIAIYRNARSGREPVLNSLLPTLDSAARSQKQKR